MKTICLDYDHTYSAAPELWDVCISVWRIKSWNVILCTQRHRILDWHSDFHHLEYDMDVPCYFSDGKAKKTYLEELGFKVDIWIDDMPEKILNDSTWVNDSPELAAWRAQNANQ